MRRKEDNKKYDVEDETKKANIESKYYLYFLCFFGVVGNGYMVELHNHITIKRKDFKNPSKSNLSF